MIAKTKCLLLLLVSLAGASLPNEGYAGTQVGKVTRLMPHVQDIVIFDLDGTSSGRPACSTQSTQWALSLRTETGKAMYALLLSAHANGRAVRVQGTGACGAWGDREEPLFMYM